MIQKVRLSIYTIIAGCSHSIPRVITPGGLSICRDASPFGCDATLALQTSISAANDLGSQIARFDNLVVKMVNEDMIVSHK